ncbi:hypothetical protein T492DRAFT_834048 [Pavlovales sp. CCMP2436]|nr:hypothetical protein T492DRAFT_834048 [Pavlovales sp. CCMP2436]
MVQGVCIEDGCIVDTNPATGEVLARVKCTPVSERSGASESDGRPVDPQGLAGWDVIPLPARNPIPSKEGCAGRVQTRCARDGRACAGRAAGLAGDAARDSRGAA